jgi:hypothetical protein
LDSLYLLSLLLTADQIKAEQCFTAGFRDSLHSSAVFKDQAYAWSKIAIVKNAIATVQPRPPDVGSPSPTAIPEEHPERPEMRESSLYLLLLLPDFVRFVFVLSVLERHARHECALLLGCSIREIKHAQVRAVELIANPDPGLAALPTAASASAGGVGDH